MNRIFTISLIVFTGLVLTDCKEEDTGPKPTGNTKTFELNSVSDPAISGTVSFIENDDNSITIDIQLSNTPDGGEHPAHIHFNTAAEGGSIALSLGSVDGTTGMSTITVSELDDTTPISYAELLDFDGYVNVHLSATDLATLVAQGDIGQNELTGLSKEYALGSVSDPNISGSATFEERVNGEALATLLLSNTPAGGSHPAHIHLNTAAEGGGIAFTFSPVDGGTGMSKTNVAKLDDDSAFGYDDVLDYSGYINVHLSASELSTLVAQGDIGQNELTGEKTTYEIEERNLSGVSGVVDFEERVNGTTLVTLTLTGTTGGEEHPAHIHNGNAAIGGTIAASLTSVNGTTGISKTQVSKLDDDTPITYTELLTFDGYVNVHLSAGQLGVTVAQGNIGSNSDVINYNVTNSGSASYIFNGAGLSDAANPDLTLKRGMTYTFSVNASGHPFIIKSVQGTGTGNAYNEGVTNNGTESGTITFTVPNDAPNTLFYNCQFHSGMTGTITITD